jgi:hypothetical protein
MHAMRHWISSCALALAVTGCASTRSSAGTPKQPGSAPAGAAAAESAAIDVPLEPTRALATRRIVARGLLNPRGMQLVADGLLVSEAGTGDPASAKTGRLIKLVDANGDGDYLDKGEKRVLLDGQPSKNILEIVRRDEVFGMAGMDQGVASGEPATMVALAFFGGPSTLFAVRGDRVEPWGKTHGNINDVAFDSKRSKWFGASSTTDEVVELLAGSGSQRVLKLPTLASGQDAVPGYLRHDPISGDLLVSLFSGSPEGEEGGEGTELVPRAASIVRVDPDRKTAVPFITGLTVPTDLELDEAGAVYVLEFCDAFLDPVGTRQAMAKPGHGGFRRYSGRLLRIDRSTGAVQVLAEQLDAPTNIARAPGGFLVAEGMGTPGRTIPTPDGDAPLEGFIELIQYP